MPLIQEYLDNWNAIKKGRKSPPEPEVMEPSPPDPILDKQTGLYHIPAKREDLIALIGGGKLQWHNPYTSLAYPSPMQAMWGGPTTLLPGGQIRSELAKGTAVARLTAAHETELFEKMKADDDTEKTTPPPPSGDTPVNDVIKWYLQSKKYRDSEERKRPEVMTPNIPGWRPGERRGEKKRFRTFNWDDYYTTGP